MFNYEIGKAYHLNKNLNQLGVILQRVSNNTHLTNANKNAMRQKITGFIPDLYNSYITRANLRNDYNGLKTLNQNISRDNRLSNANKNKLLKSIKNIQQTQIKNGQKKYFSYMKSLINAQNVNTVKNIQRNFEQNGLISNKHRARLQQIKNDKLNLLEETY